MSELLTEQNMHDVMHKLAEAMERIIELQEQNNLLVEVIKGHGSIIDRIVFILESQYNDNK